MHFTNSRSYIPTENTQNINIGSARNKNYPMMMFRKSTTVHSSKPSPNIPMTHTSNNTTNAISQVDRGTIINKRPLSSFNVKNHIMAKQKQHPQTPPEEIKKIIWGEPFWNLFHLIAEKVKESDFPKVRSDVLRIIFSICSNLPCPDCTTHAVHYLNNINFNNIQTKEQLKNMLYMFHNEVNTRTHRPLFPRDQLDEKYSKGIFLPNLDRFFHFFSMKHNNARLISNDIFRVRLTKNLKEWFQTNLHCFET